MPKRPTPPPDVSPARLEAYERLVGLAGLERKGAAVPYTSINGNMSSFVDASGIALRLSAADRVEFIGHFGAKPHEAHGTTMKEFVTVPDEGLDDLPVLSTWFERSVAYVSSLRPKPTRR